MPLLEEAHAADPSDADTALLLGIAYFRTGRQQPARTLLEQAERDGDNDGKASARVFLGLIADETGHEERARVYYEQVARTSPELAASTRLLIDQAGPARWLVVGVMRPEYDSNVELLPMTSGRGRKNTAADAELDLVLAVSARVFHSVPFVLDQTLAYDKQARLTAYDMLSDRVGATYVLVRGRERASLAYHFEASRLGGAKYQVAHVADLAARHRLGDALALGARYTFAARDYGGDYASYTGLTHTGLVQVVHGTRAQPFEVAAGYQVEREGTSDPALTMIGHGPRADLRWRAWKRGELRSSLTFVDRIFDTRRDEYLTTEAALYLDLTTAFGLVTGGTFTVNKSNDKSSEYTKWTVFAGMLVVVSR